MRIIVALEPRSHRDTLCDAIAQLRPTLDPVAFAPSRLDACLRSGDRLVVLLSEPLPGVQERVFAWLVLDSGPDARARVSIAGRERTIDRLELSSLLTFLDEIAVAERMERRALALPVGEPGEAIEILGMLWQGIVGRWRALRGMLAPWQYVHLVLIPALLLITFGLICHNRAETLGELNSCIILGALAGIAAIEARQYRRTRGMLARG